MNFFKNMTPFPLQKQHYLGQVADGMIYYEAFENSF